MVHMNETQVVLCMPDDAIMFAGVYRAIASFMFLNFFLQLIHNFFLQLIHNYLFVSISNHICIITFCLL